MLRIVQHSSSHMEFKDQSTRADQMVYLKMKHEVHDKQIAYLMDSISQLYEKDARNDSRISYLMSRICQLPGENIQQNNPEGLIGNL